MKIKKALRSIAVMICVIFSSNTILLSAPERVYTITVPTEYGTVTSRWRTTAAMNVPGQKAARGERSGDESGSPSGARSQPKTIIHIQDAHASLEAQENIARIIESLRSGETETLIAVEGAVGTITTDIYREFPVRSVRQAVAHTYLTDGVLSGAEYGVITADTDAELFGAEDETLFVTNFKDYYAAQKERETTLGLIDRYQVVATELKPHIYNSALLRFDRLVSDWEHDRMELSEMLSVLGATLIDCGLDILDFPVLAAVCHDAGRAPGAFSIDSHAFLRDIERAARAIKHALAETEHEHLLIEYAYYIRVLGGLASLEVKPSEVEFFREASARHSLTDMQSFFESAARIYGVEETVPRVSTMAAHAIERGRSFYHTADERSRVLVRNTLKRMEEKGLAEAFLIAGGYHTEIIEAECRALGSEYVSIAPRIEDLTQTVSFYEKMSGKLFPIMPHLMSTITAQSLYLMQDENRIPFWKEITHKEIAETIRMIITADPAEQTEIETIRKRLISFCSKEARAYVVDPDSVRATISSLQKEWKAAFSEPDMKTERATVLQEKLHDSFALGRYGRETDLFKRIKTELQKLYVSANSRLSHAEPSNQVAYFPNDMQSYSYLRRPFEFYNGDEKMNAPEVMISSAEFAWVRDAAMRNITDGHGYVSSLEEICESDGFYNCHAVIIRNRATKAYLFAHVYAVIDKEVVFYNATGERYGSVRDALHALGDDQLEAFIIGRPLNEDGKKNLQATARVLEKAGVAVDHLVQIKGLFPHLYASQTILGKWRVLYNPKLNRVVIGAESVFGERFFAMDPFPEQMKTGFKKSARVEKRRRALRRFIETMANAESDRTGQPRRFTPTEFAHQVLRDKNFMAMYPETSAQTVKNDIRLDSDLCSSPYLDFERGKIDRLKKKDPAVTARAKDFAAFIAAKAYEGLQDGEEPRKFLLSEAVRLVREDQAFMTRHAHPSMNALMKDISVHEFLQKSPYLDFESGKKIKTLQVTQRREDFTALIKRKAFEWTGPNLFQRFTPDEAIELALNDADFMSAHSGVLRRMLIDDLKKHPELIASPYLVRDEKPGLTRPKKEKVVTKERAAAFLKVITSQALIAEKRSAEPVTYTSTEAIRLALRDKEFMALFPETTDDDLRNDIKRHSVLQTSPYLLLKRRGPYVKNSQEPKTDPERDDAVGRIDDQAEGASGSSIDYQNIARFTSPVLERLVEPDRKSYYASIELVPPQAMAFFFSDTLAREMGFPSRSALENDMRAAIGILDTIIMTSGSRTNEEQTLDVSPGTIVLEFSHQARHLIGDGKKNGHIVLQSAALQALSAPVRRIVFRVALLQELMGAEAGFFDALALNAESALLTDALARLENVTTRDILGELETVLSSEALYLELLKENERSWWDQMAAFGVPLETVRSMVEADPDSIYGYPVTLMRTLARKYHLATHLFNGNFLLVDLHMDQLPPFPSVDALREDQHFVDMENVARIYADFLWGFYMFQSFDPKSDLHQNAFLQWNEFISPLLDFARAPDLRSLQLYIWEKLYAPLTEIADDVGDMPPRVIGENRMLIHPLETPRFKEVVQLLGSALNAPNHTALFELIASAACRLEDPLFYMNTQIVTVIIPQLLYLQMYLYWLKAQEPPLRKALLEFRELFDLLMRTVPESLHRRGIDLALADAYELYQESPLYTVEKYLHTERSLSARSFRIIADALAMVRFRYVPAAVRLYPEAFDGRQEELEKILRRMARLEATIYQLLAAQMRYENYFFGEEPVEEADGETDNESSDADEASDESTTLRDMVTGLVSAIGIDAWFGSSYGVIALGVWATYIVWMMARSRMIRTQKAETTSGASQSTEELPAPSVNEAPIQPGRIHCVFNRHTYFASKKGAAARDRLADLFQQADSVYLENAGLFVDIYNAVARAEETPQSAFSLINDYLKQRGMIYFPDEQRRVLEALYDSQVTVRGNASLSGRIIPYESVSLEALIKGDQHQVLDLFERMIYYRAEDAARRDQALAERVRGLRQTRPDERIVIVRGMMHTALRDSLRAYYPETSVTDELFSNDGQALMYADLIREAEYQHLGLLDMRDFTREELVCAIYSYILGIEHARVNEVTDFSAINDIAAHAASQETFAEFVRYVKSNGLANTERLPQVTIEWCIARGYVASDTARRLFAYTGKDKLYVGIAVQREAGEKKQAVVINPADEDGKSRAVTRYVEDTVSRLEKYRTGGNDFITYCAYAENGKKLPFVVKVPLAHKDLEAFETELRQAKEIMGGLAAPFSVLRDVTVAGKDYALLLVQQRLEIFEERLPHFARSRDGREIDLWEQQADLMIELIRRGIQYADAFTPINFGFDREKGRLYFVDLGRARLAETDDTFFARSESVLSFEQRHYFYTHTLTRGLDDLLRMHSRPSVAQLWATQRERCAPVPDITPVSPRAAQYQLGTVSVKPRARDAAIPDEDASAALQYEHFLVESLDSYETIMRHFAPEGIDAFSASVYDAAEYLVHRQHVLDKKITLVVTDAIREQPVFQFLVSQVSHLAISIETFDPSVTYDPQEHIILAYENHARSEARAIKRARPDLLVIGFDPTSAASAIEFLPTIIAIVLWFHGSHQIDERRLFNTVGVSNDLQNIIMIDGRIAAALLSDIHTEFLQAQFKTAA
jgi:hypothetical protein